MKVIFRVDASLAMGTGHVMRCLALATALKKQGASVHFVTRAHSGHLAEVLERDGFNVVLLPHSAGNQGGGNTYADWLGVSQQEDAAQTIDAIVSLSCDWLIVDHYGLDQVWEEQLKPHTRKLMVIDDLANRMHACDLLLDQNYAVGGEARYQSWVPRHCHLLLGPRYALLRPEYAQYRENMVPRTGEIKRILVYMGGADNINVTSMILFALCATRFVHLEVDVVIGPNYLFKNEVIRLAKLRPNTHIHGTRSHLADLMAKADLAVGAGGATTWERICMGLPALVISIAENQAATCEALEFAGLIRYLGDAHKINIFMIEEALSSLLADAMHLQIVGPSLKSLVDGLGVNRVVEALKPSPLEHLTLRQANPTDVLTYFSWVNDAKVRSMAFDTDPIALNVHLEWFSNRLSDANARLYILEADGLPVGQIRFELHNEEATIDYSLDEFVRGRDWANQLLKLGIAALNPDKQTLLNALVKQNNFASSATFLRFGFIENMVNKENGVRHFQLPIPVGSLGIQADA
jgi:UDP-2,4-diacetamido-2,4,6-trideoxy-beta-L-altropyranose hydrolase